MAVYYLANGYARGENFPCANDKEAINICERTSESMNTANWLYKVTDNGTIELGRTYKRLIGYVYWWKFQNN